MAAVEVGVGGDTVADGKAADAGAQLDDLGRDLVPDDAGELHRQPPGLDMLDGQPGAAGEHARDRFARSGDGIGNLAQLERRVGAAQQQSFHDPCPRQND